MKTLADFKRAVIVNAKVETLATAYGVKENGRVFVGQVRFVSHADTTGVYLKNFEDVGSTTRGSFLGFDKAGDWNFEGNVATNTKFGYSYKVIGV